MTIRSGPPNALYDAGWERCFGKGAAKAAEEAHLEQLGAEPGSGSEAAARDFRPISDTELCGVNGCRLPKGHP